MRVSLFFLLLFVLSCCRTRGQSEITLNDVPWFVSVYDSVLVNFDPKNEFSKLSDSEALNSAKGMCYIADLHYIMGETEIARSLVNSALELDDSETINNYILPIYKYMKRSRPDRRKSIPPIVKFDLEYFTRLYHEEIDTTVSYNNYLHQFLICKIRLYDQWYRSNQRDYISENQDLLDLETQLLMDSSFFNKDLSNYEDARNIFYITILHSKDCDWSKKWIIKFNNDFRGGKYIRNHLKHYLYRSECRDVVDIRDFIEHEISLIEDN